MGLDIKPNATQFTIKGFSDLLELQVPLFILLLLIYLVIIFGNMTIFTTISQDPQLHTPMYVFVMNLSLIDISYTSTILPNLLNMLITHRKTISLTGCLTQMYFFLCMACSEAFLLAAMAYDRYVAICHPLHYVYLMSLRRCAQFIAAVWTIGFVDTVGYPILVAKMSFCDSKLIEHIFCDVVPLLKLSCSDTFNVELLTYLEGSFIVFSLFLFTLISYFFIISTILKIRSAEGRHKAFSTCASHLTCVVIYYGTIMCLYMRPTSNYSPDRDKFFSLLYILLVPMLNPVIYSLKNQDVKNGLNKLKNRNTIDLFASLGPHSSTATTTGNNSSSSRFLFRPEATHGKATKLHSIHLQDMPSIQSHLPHL
ncbi:olfactory receptor 1019-like [Bombina bombina]|uniref:olfactory receptor 1019-like n=1 Tax=Bombina bombina TaxID=8345 RepID=UPI00235AAECE|nr:olfactory receptor 1019-like [Bombina bombina]